MVLHGRVELWTPVVAAAAAWFIFMVSVARIFLPRQVF